MKRRWAGVVALMGAVSLLGACSSNSKGSAGPASPGASATTAGSGGSGSAQLTALEQDALTAVGGTAGKADPTLAPITVGYVNDQGGAVSFPDATSGLNAAISLINNKLGGIQGHAINVVDCFIQTEEDGQKCGTQMVNNSAVQVVLMGNVPTGGDSFYSVLNGAKPVMILDPATASDYSAKNGYAFSGGVAAGYLGIGKFISENLTPKPKSVAVITVNVPAGIAAINNLVAPTLKAAGITDIRIAQVSPTATGPEIASAVQAANAGSADVILVSLLSSGCVPTYQALQSLHVSKPVVTTNLCYAASVGQALGGKFPDGWYYAGLGWNPYLPADPNVPNSWVLPLNVQEVEAQPGGQSIDPSGAAIYTFGPMLTIAAILHQIGASNISAATIATAMKAYKGPLYGTAGNADCGKNPAFPTVCGSAVGFQQYTNGKFVSVADGYNGKAVLAW